ncbi:hypothetical protein RS82_00051 [Microbacterium trichothecenolyticum]|uniref:Uncharacterized protein n=1 Tax=Microbacterium trichothecenolyticum TaxID=69370 RepID=A0A0M2HMU2_MICTR|nr:hypothetical protein RS82_00051 [Microbacterium trichothecenolyticum]
MHTTTTPTGHPTTGHGPTAPGSIVAWDQLEGAVDHLADIVEEILHSHDDQVICSLQFDEAEALAEVLDAGRHTRTAARLMHRWALTEPDWETDTIHEPTLRGWLDIDTHPQADGIGH